MIRQIRVGDTPTRLLSVNAEQKAFRITNNLGVNADNPEIRLGQYDNSGLVFTNGRPLVAGKTFSADKLEAPDYVQGIFAIGTVPIVPGAGRAAVYQAMWFLVGGDPTALSDIRGLLIDLSRGVTNSITFISFLDVDQDMTATLTMDDGTYNGLTDRPGPKITFRGRLATATLGEYAASINSNTALNQRYRFDCIELAGVSYSTVVPTHICQNHVSILSIPVGGARKLTDYEFELIYWPNVAAGTAIEPADNDVILFNGFEAVDNTDTGGTLVAVEVST